MVKYSPETVFGALGSVPRRKIVEELSKKSSLSVSALAKPLNMSLPGVMKHLQILHDAGVARTQKKGRVSYWSINSSALDGGIDWLLAQKQYWEGAFDRLERHLKNKKR